jgi:hypothetical protein
VSAVVAFNPGAASSGVGGAACDAGDVGLLDGGFLATGALAGALAFSGALEGFCSGISLAGARTTLGIWRNALITDNSGGF